MSGVYNADSIFTPERLQHVRMRPTAYFNSTDIEGLMHQALEIITNSIDEIALMPELAGILQLILCVDAERQTYQLIIKDSGRGLPITKLLDAFTKLHTSGKFDQGAYEHSGGLFGVGAKASAATATDFVAVTHTSEGSAAIRVHEGNTNEVLELIEEVPTQTGVTVVYEPDPIIFPTDIPLFAVEGQRQLITILQKYCFFHRMNIEFRVHPLALPKTIWTAKIPEVEAVVAKYWAEANVVFNEATFDRQAWIRSYFNITRPFALQHSIRDTVATTITAPTIREVMMRYEVKFYTTKFDTLGGRFGMVNNVGIDDQKSTHFAAVMDAVKILLSGFIKDNALRKFFLDQYRLSLYLAVDVKFPGAAFAGTTKTGFISKQFRSIYEPSLQKQLAHPDSQKFLEAYYRDIEVDIESRYTSEILGVVKVKNYDRLFEEFADITQSYTPCSTTNRRMAELFLVEGKSAGSSVASGRNPETQALFTLRGKPFNGITSENKVRQSAIAIRNDEEVYSKLIAVTGINPAKFDLNSLNFGKINILTDADNE
jgi:DNA gyrase subunit B